MPTRMGEFLEKSKLKTQWDWKNDSKMANF